MKTGRILATVVAIVVGLLVLVDVFVTQWPNSSSDLNQITQRTGALLVSWTAVVLAFALFLGFANVAGVHWSRIRSQKPGSIYSIVLLISLKRTSINSLSCFIFSFSSVISTNNLSYFN